MEDYLKNPSFLKPILTFPSPYLLFLENNFSGFSLETIGHGGRQQERENNFLILNKVMDEIG